MSALASEKQGVDTADAELVVYDFTIEADLSDWEVEDDIVMGGRSLGKFKINEEGNGLFTGDVSLENGGGFSSIQRYIKPIPVTSYRYAILRIKGDGKSYQFRVESSRDERHNYVYSFPTSGEWETITVPFADMYPEFHGDRLDLPNYPGETMSQIRFLVANNLAESFRLEIDRVSLR